MNLDRRGGEYGGAETSVRGLPANEVRGTLGHHIRVAYIYSFIRTLIPKFGNTEPSSNMKFRVSQQADSIFGKPVCIKNCSISTHY